MRTSILASAFLAACGVNAIQITDIAKGQKIDLAAGFTVTWSTVNTDPSTGHLVLVNMAGGHTPFNQDLGAVDLTKGSFRVISKNAKPDTGYQFNIQSVSTGSTGILAQSEQFEVLAAGGDNDNDDTKTSSSKTASGAATATTGAPTSGTTDAGKPADSEDSTATTLATVAATGSAAGTRTGTAAPPAQSTGAAAVNKVGVAALLAGLAAVMA